MLKIDAGAQGGFIEFSPSAKVDPEKFIKLIQQNPIVYRFDGPLKFKFVKALPENKERLEFVMDLLKNLTEYRISCDRSNSKDRNMIYKSFL